MNWHLKINKLVFYNDEKPAILGPKQPPKPRRSKYKPEEEYQAQIVKWEASKGHPQEVKPIGNSMTQKYYTEKVLSHYIQAIQEKRLEQPGCWQLEEDNDRSHGRQKFGLAQGLRTANWIDNHDHPPQSPDLSPIEGVWLILKERVRKRAWNTLEEFKKVIQEVWEGISQSEVQERIADMPWRCRTLAETGGMRVRSEKW